MTPDEGMTAYPGPQARSVRADEVEIDGLRMYVLRVALHDTGVEQIREIVRDEIRKALAQQ